MRARPFVRPPYPAAAACGGSAARDRRRRPTPTRAVSALAPAPVAHPRRAPRWPAANPARVRSTSANYGPTYGKVRAPALLEEPVIHRHIHLGAAALALAAMVALPEPTARLGGQSPSGVVAIRNATLLTVTRGTIANGTIVLQNGKIAAIGTNVNIPAGAEVIDGTGRFVSPGPLDRPRAHGQG